MKSINSISLMFPLYKDKRTVKKMIFNSLKILKKTNKKFEIIIVDDGCPQQSGIYAKKIASKISSIKVIFHKKNLGYGAALKTGIKKCKYQWIFQIDGDAEYNVNDLPRLMKSSATSDLVITYRYQKKYKTIRIIISWIYNMTLRLLFRTNFRDVSTGSRFFNRSILKKIKLSTNSPFIGAELAIKSKLKGFRINQIGIHTFPRTFGEGSSVGIRNIILTIKDMLLLFFRINFKNDR